MCTLSLYDVIEIMRHVHIKLKSFSNIAQSLHKEAVHGCSFLYIIAKKSVILSEAFLVDVSIYLVHNSIIISHLHWTLTGCPPVQGKSPPVQVKEPYGDLDMVLVGFHPASRSVQSTPADNTRKRVWQ